MGKLLNNLNDIIMKFVGVIMLVAPIGLGAYFANLVATYGPEIIGDYGRSMLVYYPLCALYCGDLLPPLRLPGRRQAGCEGHVQEHPAAPPSPPLPPSPPPPPSR